MTVEEGQYQLLHGPECPPFSSRLAIMSQVECFFVPPTKDVPNSRLPILVYRGVLPHPKTENTATQFLTRNRWEKRVCSPNPTLLAHSDSRAQLPANTSSRELGDTLEPDTSTPIATSVMVSSVWECAGYKNSLTMFISDQGSSKALQPCC